MKRTAIKLRVHVAYLSVNVLCGVGMGEAMKTLHGCGRRMKQREAGAFFGAINVSVMLCGKERQVIFRV